MTNSNIQTASLYEKYNLQQVLDTIPNCIICGKKLNLNLTHRIYDKLNLSYKAVNLLFKINSSGDLSAVNKLFYYEPIVINPKTNIILKNDKFIHIIQNCPIFLHKRCKTCDFNINYVNFFNINNKNMIPFVAIESIFMQYYIADHKYLIFNQILSGPENNRCASVFIESSSFKIPLVNFNKITTLKQLNFHIKTMLLLS